jgi:hypothetical protein
MWQARYMELEIAPLNHGLPLVVQATDAPVIVGVGEDASDVRCPSCRDVVLLANVPDAGVYDLAIQCFRCKAIVRAPRLPPGRGVGGIAHVVEPGQHIARDSFVADCDQLVIGTPGVLRRAAETGSVPGLSRHLLMDASGLVAVLVNARKVFGPIMAGLERSGRAHKRHRLVHLIGAVERNLAAIEDGSHEVDVLSVIELEQVSSKFERWKLDPSYERLLTECVSPSTFSHNALLLAVASTLADAHLGVEFVSPNQEGSDGGRTPDLRIRMSARKWIEADIKTPVTLQRLPEIAVPAKPAQKIIENTIRSSRGQFSTAALLVVGGSFWAGDFDEYETAVARVLGKPVHGTASPEARNHHDVLAGVILASTLIQSARTRGTGDFQGNWNEVDWKTDTVFRWVANPHYALDFGLSFAKDLSTFEAQFRP